MQMKNYSNRRDDEKLKTKIMKKNTSVKKRAWINSSKISILLIVLCFLFFAYNTYQNSYSEFVLYKATRYAEFKPLVNFRDYDKVKLKKLFSEYGIEYKEEKGVFLIKNKDLNFEDLMYTISDQYFH
jgi:hypothetical protein